MRAWIGRWEAGTGWLGRRWPRSLASRTALVLLGGLVLVQISGLTLHALDRLDLMEIAQTRDLAVRAMNAYRSVALADPAGRTAVIGELSEADEMVVSIGPDPPGDSLPPVPELVQRQMRADMQLVPIPQSRRPTSVVLLGGDEFDRLTFGMQLPEGTWLTMRAALPPVRPWHSVSFLPTFAAMSAAALLLTLWAVRRLTAPVGTLAAAAEALGRDVNAPPLAETGPREVAQAAVAFNTMAARIRRFVEDRTFLLTAIGHDLRTPITRLRLRAEFMEDDEQRRRMVGDLDELEAMVAATLTFGRDATLSEPAVPVDLVALIGTVLDDAADARPELDEKAIGLMGPERLTVQARPVAMKRALTNLVSNALNYGHVAHAVLLAPVDGMVVLHIDDNGPGVPEAAIERVFLPFHRLEASRNRETGGVGLGLPIARNIVRAHGGDVVLTNRHGGGLRATVTLPI